MRVIASTRESEAPGELACACCTKAVPLTHGIDPLELGVVHPVQANGIPIRLEGGLLAAVLSVELPDGQVISEAQAEQLTQLATLAGGAISDRLMAARIEAAERRFESLFENALGGNIIMRPHRDESGRFVDMRIEHVNDTACRILGLERSDWEGRLHKSVFPASRTNGVVESYIRVYETGEPWRYEFFYEDARLSGWHEVSAVRIADGVAVTFLDVTERVENARDLSDHNRTLELFLEHTPACVAMFDKEMRFVTASSHWLKIYGFEGRDLEGARHESLFPDIPERWREMQQRALAGESFNYEADRLVQPDGTERWIRWSMHPWYESDGVVGGIVTFTDDVTDRKLIEDALHESQQRLDLSLESAGIALWDWRVDQDAVEVNSRWFTMLGYEPDEFDVTCDRWQSLIHPDDRGAVVAAVDSHIAGDTPRFCEQYRLLTKDRGYTWVECVGRALERDESGAATRVIGVYFDIDAVRTSEQRLALALEGANIGLWDLDIVSGDAFFSDHLWTMLGYSPSSPPGPPGITIWRELVHNEDLPDAERSLAAHLAGESEAYAAEFRMLCADETYRWVRGIGRVVEHSAEGAPVRMLGINIDVHEQRLAQDAIEHFATDVADAKAILEQQADELARSNDQLEIARAEAVSANQAKSEFLANMSHEIRTPMTAILGYAELLGDSAISHEQRLEHAKTIIRNGNHLLEIINDILDLSRIEAGRMTIEQIECSPAEVIAGIIDLLRPRAVAKGIDLSVEFSGPVPSRIKSDPTRLRQILLNLIGNAVKFTQRGSVRIRVSLEREQDDCGVVRFDVIDTGIGIPPDRVGSLFQSFSQTDSSHTRRFGGTGLGLTISARLARLLGGCVTLLDSAPGEGSTFRLSINAGPIRSLGVVAPHEIGSLDQDQTEAIAAPLPELAGRILLAEDGIDNQRLLSYHLRTAGAKVDLVANGQDAINAIRNAIDEGDQYDLVLMDMQMPVMDGLTATRTLRDSGYTRPIVALTAHAMQAERDRCLEYGCNEHLAKPISRRDLVEAASHWIKRARRLSA